METGPIIAELDPAGNVFPRLLPRGIGGAVDQLHFQRSVDGFCEGIVETDPGPADGLPYPEFPQFRRELS